jgi:hypothetical protein
MLGAVHCTAVPRFYFDHLDGATFLRDSEGLEYATLEQALEEARAALGSIARDALPSAKSRELAIEVSDENRTPLFRVVLWFEVQDLAVKQSA